jgi:hypothetical protein
MNNFDWLSQAIAIRRRKHENDKVNIDGGALSMRLAKKVLQDRSSEHRPNQH